LLNRLTYWVDQKMGDGAKQQVSHNVWSPYGGQVNGRDHRRRNQRAAVHGTPPGSLPTPTPTPAPFDCLSNGAILAGCHSTATLGDQICTFPLDASMRQVIITC
jgi:hypothetical protein